MFGFRNTFRRSYFGKPQARNLNLRARWTLGGPLTSKIPKKGNYFVKGFLGILGAFASLSTLIYAISTPEEVPYVGRTRLKLPWGIEEKMGEYYTGVMISTYETQIVNFDHPLVKTIQAIGDHVCRSNNIPLHKFVLIDDPQVNAFVLPGRTVFVYTGILPVLSNRDGAAMVIAHEIGHTLAGHGFSKLVVSTPLIWFSTKLIGMPGAYLAEIIDAVRSRTFEDEADRIGLYMVANSCLDINESVAVFQRMKECCGELEEGLFDTHPSWSHRINELVDTMKKEDLIRLNSKCKKRESNWLYRWRENSLKKEFIIPGELPKMTVQQKNDMLKSSMLLQVFGFKSSK